MGDEALIADAIARRTAEVVTALVSVPSLGAPSTLPGWSLETIACHLRYGAQAVTWMCRDTAAGRATAFYPGGRSAVRDATLRPSSPDDDVVASLSSSSAELDDAIRSVDWSLTITESEPDLGPITLRRLILGRLTEVEVHGSDLGLGLSDWSDVFVGTVLPERLDWLPSRRSNHRPVDESLQGSWLLRAPERSWRLTVAGSSVWVDEGSRLPADAVISASERDLLALLLGRPFTGEVVREGELASEFERAFPGP